MSTATPTPHTAHASEPFQPVAAVLAIIFPGLGHAYLGHTKRAAIIAAGVLFLFTTGLFVGGISCIDRREDFNWFLGQALNGPIAFGVDYIHQHHFKVQESVGNSFLRIRSALPNEYRAPGGVPVPIAMDAQGVPRATLPDGTVVSPAYPPYIKGVGRMRELGTLFTTIAGFMNLIVIIDAAFNRHRSAAKAPEFSRL